MYWLRSRPGITSNWPTISWVRILRYWGLAAKFALELLARGCFIPGLAANDGVVSRRMVTRCR